MENLKLSIFLWFLLLIVTLLFIKEKNEFYYKCKNLGGTVIVDSIAGNLCAKPELIEFK